MRARPFYFEIKDMLTQFVAAFDDIVIGRFNRNREEKDKINVRYVYAPKQRVLYDLVNENKTLTLPVVSVNVNNISRDENRVFNKLDGFYYQGVIGDERVSRHIKAPVPINISLSVSVLTRYQTDMDQILSNFVPFCNPYVVISWKVPEKFNLSVDQEIRSEVLWNGDVNLNYPVEVTGNQKARVTADTSFTIKGWLFKDTDDPSGNIFFIDSNFHTETQLEYYDNYESLSGNSYSPPVSTGLESRTDSFEVSGSPFITDIFYNGVLLQEDLTICSNTSGNVILNGYSLGNTDTVLFSTNNTSEYDNLTSLSDFNRQGEVSGQSIPFTILNDNTILLNSPPISAGKITFIPLNKAGYDFSHSSYLDTLSGRGTKSTFIIVEECDSSGLPIGDNLRGSGDTDIPCQGINSYAGVQGTYTYDIILGSLTGEEVVFNYEAFSIPDRFIVEHDGVIVVDTGYVGNTFYNTELASLGLDPVLKAGSGQGFAQFTKTSPLSTATVTVSAPLPGTAFNFTLNCPTVNPGKHYPPVITLNGDDNLSAECGDIYTDQGATGFDEQDGIVPVRVNQQHLPIGFHRIPGTYTITFSAADSDGNIGTASRIITIVDTTPPVITLNGSQFIDVIQGNNYIELSATANDHCDGVIPLSAISIDNSSVDTSTLGIYTVSYSATDSAGNVGTNSRVVNVIESPGNVPCEGQRFYTGNQGTFTYDINLGSLSGEVVLQYEAFSIPDRFVVEYGGVNVIDTGFVGNSFYDSQVTGGVTSQGNGAISFTKTSTLSSATVTVFAPLPGTAFNFTLFCPTSSPEDLFPPIITLNGSDSLTAECGFPYTELSATAEDNKDGILPLSAISIGGDIVDTSTKGTYTVTYSAIDSDGNIGTNNRIVQVIDTIPPVITLNGDNPIDINRGNVYTELSATATDHCDGVIPLSAIIIDNTNVDTSTIGTYTVGYSATDSEDNVGTASRTVNVVLTGQDLVPCDGQRTFAGGQGSHEFIVNLGSQLGDVVLEYQAYYVPDRFRVNFDGVEVINTGFRGGSLYYGAGSSLGVSGPGQGTAQFEKTDVSPTSAKVFVDAPNPGTLFTFTLHCPTTAAEDLIPPVITLNGNDALSTECGFPYTEQSGTAEDNKDGTVPVVVGGDTVDTNTKGTYYVTYSASDSDGNIGTHIRQVTVVDTTPPVITLNGASTINVNINSTYTELGASANDHCDGVLTVTIGGDTVDTTTVGTYIVTYTATDSEGNTTTVTRTVNVIDETDLNNCLSLKEWLNVPDVDITPWSGEDAEDAIYEEPGDPPPANPNIPGYPEGTYKRVKACLIGVIIRVDGYGNVVESATTGSTENNQDLVQILIDEELVPGPGEEGCYAFVFEFFGWRIQADDTINTPGLWLPADDKYDIYDAFLDESYTFN